MSKARLRLDTWLVKQGIATDAGHAKVLIDQGVILVNGSIALTDNRMIANSDSVLLSTPARFVSRGGEKLEAALQSFAKSAHKAAMDAIDAEPVLKKHEATLKKICDDFAATGSY